MLPDFTSIYWVFNLQLFFISHDFCKFSTGLHVHVWRHCDCQWHPWTKAEPLPAFLTLSGRFSFWNFMYSSQGHLAFGIRWHSLFRHIPDSLPISTRTHLPWQLFITFSAIFLGPGLLNLCTFIFRLTLRPVQMVQVHPQSRSLHLTSDSSVPQRLCHHIDADYPLQLHLWHVLWSYRLFWTTIINYECEDSIGYHRLGYIGLCILPHVVLIGSHKLWYI